VARALAKTEAFERSRRDRKRVEMLFAHLKRIFNEAPEKTRASGLNYFRLNRRLGVTRRHEHLQLSIAELLAETSERRSRSPNIDYAPAAGHRSRDMRKHTLHRPVRELVSSPS
jgi:hypothetical protein